MKRNTLVHLFLGLSLLLTLGVGIVSSSSRVLAQEGTVQGSMLTQEAVGTAFTYQGRLTNASGPVSGNCDFRFELWTAATGGQQAGDTVEKTGVSLDQGVFSVELDFTEGSIFGPYTFAGDKRWLSVSVRCPSGSGSYTNLSGRVPLNPAPYALSLRPGAMVAGNVSSGYALSVGNSTTAEFGAGMHVTTTATKGTALYAEAASTSLEKTYGVYATAASRGGVGVYGESTYGGSTVDNTGYGGYFKAGGFGDVGVYAESAWSQGGGIGVEAKTNAPYGYGVKAVATSTKGEATGVYGKSSSPAGYGGSFVSMNHIGVYASGSSDGDIALGGDEGSIVATEESDSALYLRSNDSFYIYLDNNNDQNFTVSSFNILDGSDRLNSIFQVDDNGDTYIYGDLRVNGAKNNVVSTANHGRRLLYAMESPEYWFEDFGSARLAAGKATVTIDALFAETVNLSEDYHVFLTPLGDCALYVAEKTSTSFTVRAIGGRQCNIAFDYRLVAKRLGYEQVRLEEAK